MSAILNKYLDPAALDETVVNIRELIDGLEEEMQGLPYARPDGLYPDMTVGAVIGADSTAQWATRESTGSGTAIVRSVQGATVVWNQLAGADTSTVTIPSGNKYLSVIGGTSAVATSDGTVISVTGGTDQVFDLTIMFGSGNEPSTVAEFEAMYPESYYPYSAPTLKPVRIAGIASTDANGDALDGVEWETQTLRAAGSVRDELTAGELVTRVGVVQVTGGASSTIAQNTDGTCINALVLIPNYDSATGGGILSDQFTETSAGWRTVGLYEVRNAGASGGVFIGLPLDVSTQAQVNAWLAEHKPTFWYELATPTTTPISPALPMTYKVQQGGSESIIVPDGEISAAPVITIAEPVNAGDEFARIWAAIQSLGYTRNTAQLSRPVSLTDIGSIDEVQKDTTEIDTTKEVTE